MSTQATGGLGTKLSVEMGSPLAFAVIAEVSSNVDTPVMDRPRYDATHMQSTARDYVMSRLLDPQEVTYETNYVPSDAGQQLILSSLAVHNFKIEMFEDDGTTAIDTATFSGYFTKAHTTNPVDGIKKVQFSIQTTGPVSRDFGV